MDWFLALLAFTTIVRGVGAGIIYDVAVVSLSVRHDIGAVPCARYARALFAGRGAATFVPVAIGGALLSIAVAVGGSCGPTPRSCAGGPASRSPPPCWPSPARPRPCPR
jgi:hypothetical protein